MLRDRNLYAPLPPTSGGRLVPGTRRPRRTGNNIANGWGGGGGQGIRRGKARGYGIFEHSTAPPQIPKLWRKYENPSFMTNRNNPRKKNFFY